MHVKAPTTATCCDPMLGGAAPVLEPESPDPIGPCEVIVGNAQAAQYRLELAESDLVAYVEELRRQLRAAERALVALKRGRGVRLSDGEPTNPGHLRKAVG